MGPNKFIAVMVLLVSANLAGCLSEDEDKTGLELVVDYDKNNGTIVESYSDGELVSTNSVSITFDFSKTTSQSRIVTFGIDLMDNSSAMTVDANSNSNIIVEISKHGLYQVIAFAIDEDGYQKNTTIDVRIELRIEWIEYNTNNPTTLIFDPSPTNGGQNPTMIEVYSVVENPSLIEDIGGGQSVEISWSIVDEQNDVCQKKSAQLGDGESDFWNTIHFNTYQVHELMISYDDGQDYVNVNQSVSILYSE